MLLARSLPLKKLRKLLLPAPKLLLMKPWLVQKLQPTPLVMPLPLPAMPPLLVQKLLAMPPLLVQKLLVMPQWLVAMPLLLLAPLVKPLRKK